MKRRTALAILGSAATSSLAGCATMAKQLDGYRGQPGAGSASVSGAQDSSGSGSKIQPNFKIEPVSGPVTTAPIPSSLANVTYPTMGSDGAPTVFFYGGWKCPFTREFVMRDLGNIVKQYVEPGHLQIEFRSLGYANGKPFLGPDAPRASWAGLAVWQYAAPHFWRYFMTVYSNQPPERYHWATLKQLRAFLQAANVPKEQVIAKAIHTGENQDEVKATAAAFSKLDTDTVPELVYKGDMVAPNLEPNRTKQLLDRAAQG